MAGAAAGRRATPETAARSTPQADEVRPHPVHPVELHCRADGAGRAE